MLIFWGGHSYGDELGRLNIALGFVRKAVDGSKRGVAESVVRDLKVRGLVGYQTVSR